MILGDRTGEAQTGVWEQVWRETASFNPAFVAGVGDTIEGLKDASADEEWQQVEKILAGYRGIPLYLAPGNHDIWSDRSEQLFRRTPPTRRTTASTTGRPISPFWTTAVQTNCPMVSWRSSKRTCKPTRRSP